MSDDSSSSSSSGIGFGGALCLLFIGLKLGGIISWSWWWVLSPIWIGFAVIGAVVLGALVVAVVATAVEAFRGRSR